MRVCSSTFHSGLSYFVLSIITVTNSGSRSNIVKCSRFPTFVVFVRSKLLQDEHARLLFILSCSCVNIQAHA